MIFQGTLESGTVLAATAEEQERLLVAESLGAHLPNVVVQPQDGLDLLADLAETFDDLLPALLLASAILAQREREHDHGDELRGVGLGGSNTDLRAGVDVHAAVGEERDGGTDNVYDTDGQGAPLQAVAKGHQRVGGLAGLRHEHAGVVTEHRRLAIQEIGGKLDRDGDLGELLEDATHGHAAVVRGAARDEDDAAAPADRANRSSGGHPG